LQEWQGIDCWKKEWPNSVVIEAAEILHLVVVVREETVVVKEKRRKELMMKMRIPSLWEVEMVICC
jgi:hypothetical protein